MYVVQARIRYALRTAAMRWENASSSPKLGMLRACFSLTSVWLKLESNLLSKVELDFQSFMLCTCLIMLMFICGSSAILQYIFVAAAVASSLI